MSYAITIRENILLCFVEFARGGQRVSIGVCKKETRIVWFKAILESRKEGSIVAQTPVIPFRSSGRPTII